MKNKFLIYLMILVVMVNSFIPILSNITSSNVVLANETDTSTTETTKSTTQLGLLGLTDISTIEPILKFDEDLYLELTKQLLKNTDGFNNEWYKTLQMGEIDTNSKERFTNGQILPTILNAKKENGETIPPTHGIFKIPIANMGDSPGHYATYSTYAEGKELAKLKTKAFTPQAFLYTSNKSSDNKKNGAIELDIYDDEENKVIGRLIAGNLAVDGLFIDVSLLGSYSVYSNATFNFDGLVAREDILTENTNHGIPQAIYGRHLFNSIMIGNPKAVNNMAIPLFLDSYGNVVTEDNQVIVPYWFNIGLDGIYKKYLDANKLYISSPLIYYNGGQHMKDSDLWNFLSEDKRKVYEIAHAISPKDNTPFFNDKINANFKSIFTDSYLTDKTKQLKSGSTEAGNKILNIYKKGNGDLDGIAKYIANNHKNVIKKHNEQLIEMAKTAQSKGKTFEMLISDDAGSNLATTSTLSDELQYIKDASSMLGQISRLLEVGFFDLFRLLIASFVSDFYNGTALRFGISDVFYTSLLTDSVVWQNSLNTILLLIVSFTTVFLIFLGFKLFIGRTTPKEILMRVLMIAMCTLIPTVVYTPLVNLMFNVPSSAILSKEMNRMMLLDTWLKNDTDVAEVVEEETGGIYKISEIYRERSEDYTVEIVTDTTKDGKLLSDMVAQGNARPSLNQMVTVDVSLFHIYDWLKLYTPTTLGGELEDGEVAEQITLFDYLYSTYPNEYRGINKYNEYYYGIVGQENKGLKEIFGTDGVSVELKQMTFSRLVQIINTRYNDRFSEQSLGTRLYSLTSNLFYVGQEYTEGENTVSKPYDSETVELVINEVSSTNDTRVKLYGANGYSDYVKNLLKDMNNSLETREKLTNASFDIDYPKSDLMGIESIIQGNGLVGFSYQKTIDTNEATQRINREIIDRYVELYLPLKASVVENNRKTYQYSEDYILQLETAFAIINEFEFEYFPTSLSAENVTLDTYMRMLYIPMKEFTTRNKDITDVSEYIALNNDIISLITFLITLILLSLYGLIKFVVLYVLLVVAIIVTFFMNYVIKNDMNNKSWLGSVMITSMFALINLGLLLLWKVLVYSMNLVEMNRGLGLDFKPYPHVLFHSFLISLYLILAIKFVIVPTSKAVIKDANNLGGNFFSEKIGVATDKISDIFKRMTGSNNSPRTSYSDDHLGAVSLDNKTNTGLDTADSGLASAMNTTLDDEEIDENSMKASDKEAIESINSKLSTPNVHKVTDGKNPINDKGIGAKVSRVANNIGNGVSDKISGVRNSLGKSAYNVLSKGGNLLGGSTGALLGSAVGMSAQQLISGELGNVTNGANSAMNIAEMTASGVASTLAGGFLGGVLGKAKAKAKSPYTMAKASLMASQLNNIPIKSDKLSNLEDLTEEELDNLDKIGASRRLELIDGEGTHRDKSLMALDTGNSLVSDTLSSKLTQFGAVAHGSELLLNLDSNELEDEGTYGKVINDLLMGVDESKRDILSKELKLSELGTIPLSSRINDGTYTFGDMTEYQEVYDRLVQDYKAQGSSIETSTVNGVTTLRMSSDEEANDFLNEFEDRASVLSKISAKTKSPVYQTYNNEDMLSQLDSYGIGYEVDENSSEYGLSFRLTDIDKDAVNFQNLLNSNSQLSSATQELTHGHLKSTGDTIVKKLVSDELKSGNLVEGKDVVIRENDVVAISARAKTYMADIQDKFDDERANALSEFDNFTNTIGNSLSNFKDGINTENGLQFRVHDRTATDEQSRAIESVIRGTELGKQQFVMRNNYDLDDFNNYVHVLEKQKLDFENNKTSIGLIQEEQDLLNTVSRMRINGTIIRRENDSTVSVFAENESQAKFTQDYFGGIEQSRRAREEFNSLRNTQEDSTQSQRSTPINRGRNLR